MADEQIKEFTKTLSKAPMDLIGMILKRHHEAIIEEVRDQVKKLTAERNEWRDKYHDLIFQVGNSWPNETRHETAKRYIIERETPNPDACAADTTEQK